ncbi:MAG: hypothetical protein L0Z73_09490 [Gammaproteobacteria bacterium]|nr:hypothetical protein [Gammaproteobacteria bacterium]
MKKVTHLFLLLCIALVFSPINGPAIAEPVTKEQIKGLDEQVQDIKKDVLGISAELNLLEEKLLFPSNTQISFFVSLEKGSDFEPDAIQLKLDDKDMAHHIYSFKEVSAMQKGGVQRVFTGNVRTGDHNLQVTVTGKSGGSKKTGAASHSVTKGVGPQFVEIRVSGSGIEFKNW